MPNSTNGCPAKVGFQFPKCFGRGWQSRGFCPNSPHNACRLGQRDEKRKAAGGQHRNNCAATCRIVARIPDHAPLRRRPVKTSGIKIALSPRCTNEVFVMPQPYDPYDLNDSGFSARRPCSLEKTVATGLDRKKGARRRPFVISNNQKLAATAAANHVAAQPQRAHRKQGIGRRLGDALDSSGCYRRITTERVTTPSEIEATDVG